MKTYNKSIVQELRPTPGTKIPNAVGFLVRQGNGRGGRNSYILKVDLKDIGIKNQVC